MWIRVILPVLTALALGAGLVIAVRQQAAVRRHGGPRMLVEPGLEAPFAPSPRPPGRPWWGNPWLWLAVCALFGVLGALADPGYFGGTFLFLPFVWIWRGRDAAPDPRSNGHGTHD